MANGRVITGFSLPWIGQYSYSSTTGAVTYTSAQPLARGVDVSISVEASDDNIFYADNVAAENAANKFRSGTLGLTVDGLKTAAAKLIEGTPTQDTITVGSNTVNVTEYDDDQEIPYVGVGYIVRYLEDGVESYEVHFFPKVRFAINGEEAATQEEDIAYQTANLTGTIFRDDTAKHRWKRVPDAQTSEADALAVLKVLLNVTTSGGGSAGG